MKKVIYILLVLLLTSCGARKTSVKTEDIKMEQTTTVKEEVSQVSEKSESLIDTSSVYEESFEPIDSTQPMVIDRKNGIFKNTRFKATKSKKGISISKSEESVTNVKKSSLNEISMDIQTKDKQTDKKESFGSWIWLLIILGVILGYLEYKRK